MLRRAVLVAVVVLTACGDDDDDAGGGGDAPPREGASNSYADAWRDVAREQCGDGSDCGVEVFAKEDEMPAAEAPASNFGVVYDPAEDPDGAGWAVLQDFAAVVGCTLPSEQPTEGTGQIDCQTAAESDDDDSSSNASFDEDAVREYIDENLPEADVETMVESVRKGCVDYTVDELLIFLSMDANADGSLLPIFQAGCPDKVAEAGF